MKFMMGAVLAALLLPGAVAASDAPQIVVNTDARAIVAQQQEIREDAVAGKGVYGDLSERDRRRLMAEQDKVLALLEGKERSTELSQIDQTALFNSLESISAIVNQAEDERMVCERVRPTGSNRAERVCMTVAQRREAARRSQQSMDAVQTRNSRCGTACGDAGQGNAEGWN